MNMRTFIFLLSLATFPLRGTFAQVLITPGTDQTFIKEQIQVLIPDSELTFEQAQTSDKFVPSNKQFPNLGLAPHSIWLRFKLTNKTDNPQFMLEVAYPILDEVELFIPQSDGSIKSEIQGENRVFSKRTYENPNYIFDLKIPKDSTVLLYLRVQSAEQIITPLSVGKPTAIWSNLSESNLITGVYVGIVLIMFFYNLFLFFSVRDRSYFYYVFYVLAAGLTQVGITGYSFQYLWPNLPYFETASVIIFACVSGIFALLFTQNFLITRVHAKLMHKVLIGIMVIFSAGLLVSITGNQSLAFNLMQMATALSALSIFITSFIVTFKGYDPARYFLSAWSVLLIGAIIFLLKDIGILPYNNFTRYTMQGASAIEMSLLSFGLANRINILKKEKEESQHKALEIAEENERIIREQNVILEQKVNERTHELSESNANLSVALNDLKEAQTQLVEQEKMASLGQLTAGIAHEINNPINFVSSNVKPLQRDVEYLIDLMNKIESVGLGTDDAELKKAEIAKLKKEFDFDYLMEEIQYLLKGINEGSTRTAEIVKGLRLFSRVDEDDIKLANIHDGLDSTLIIINNTLNNKISIEKHYVENMPKVECYPGKLNQVFLNIMTNSVYAVKARWKDEHGGKITIRTELKDNTVIIALQDNGTGMDEATKKKLFEPFFTTKPVGEGTGLGLSIVFNTINKHNGHIRVESEPNMGTTFFITIPLTQHVISTTTA